MNLIGEMEISATKLCLLKTSPSRYSDTFLRRQDPEQSPGILHACVRDFIDEQRIGSKLQVEVGSGTEFQGEDSLQPQYPVAFRKSFSLLD